MINFLKFIFLDNTIGEYNKRMRIDNEYKSNKSDESNKKMKVDNQYINNKNNKHSSYNSEKILNNSNNYEYQITCDFSNDDGDDQGNHYIKNL